MLSNLYYLSGFNNYFNRQVKKPGSAKVSDYSDWIVYTTKPCSFNPNDNIVTVHVLNSELETDYVIVSEDNVNVSSRWFVVEAKRNCWGQWQLDLKRDLFADYWEAISSSPCYIERGMVQPTNPFIYNSENQRFNQIKTSETLLTDATKTPWLCIYFNRNYTPTDAPNQVPPTETAVITTRADVVENTDTEYSLAEMRSMLGKKIYNSLHGSPMLTTRAQWKAPSGGNITGDLWGIYDIYNGKYSYTQNPSTGSEDRYYKVDYSGATTNQVIDRTNGAIALLKTAQDELAGNMATYVKTKISVQPDLYNQIVTAGTSNTIKDTESDTLYSVEFEQQFEMLTFWVDTNSTLFNALKGYMSADFFKVNNTNGASNFKLDVWVNSLLIKSVNIVEGATLTVRIPPSGSRTPLTDAPWDMLAFPYFGDYWVQVSSTLRTSTLPNVARSVAQAIATKMPGYVADVQLLPFCPCIEYCNGGTLDISTLTQGANYVGVYSDEEAADVCWGVWCAKSSFRVDLINPAPIIPSVDAIEFKVQNECDMYRLCAPNYSEAFEFSATKNGGITGFEANCTYKPMQPYIHINPVFSGLYGKDFNDNRGLICSGDWSLPYCTSAWEQYQIQNKSYKESFQRQITNMETTYNIQRDQQKTAGVINAVTAGLNAGTSAGIAGSMINPVAGGIAGGVTGAAAMVASLYGLKEDLKASDALFEENRQYTKDQWNLSLQNIQALPNTISNIGAFDINFKYFPFLEYYTCTEEEKAALRNRIRYSGMSINAIGTISEYNSGFIQGQLIRYLGDTGDYHLTASIASELNKGVYI